VDVFVGYFVAFEWGYVAVGQAAAQFDGSEDAGGGGWDASGMFDDLVEGGAEVFATLVEEIGGFGVAVDGGTGGEIEVGDNLVGGLPVEEGGFDFGAVGMVADGAFARMEVRGLRFEVGFSGGAGIARLGGWGLLRRAFGGGGWCWGRGGLWGRGRSQCGR
jgi:hypothetical protein